MKQTLRYFLSEIFSSSPNELLIVDSKSLQILFSNEKFDALLGYDFEELYQKTAVDLGLDLPYNFIGQKDCILLSKNGTKKKYNLTFKSISQSYRRTFKFSSKST